ncbi:MAG TPA: hypothetical protein VI643_06395 [Planctomycetota bacterium]|nr:hypothetical protein [Planctomycetota bacterium]
MIPGARPHTQRGEGRESARYLAPKKSNTPLIAGLVGGGALLLITLIVIGASGGGGGAPYRTRQRGGPTGGPDSTSGAAQFGGSTESGRPLTEQERRQIAEAERKKNEALQIQEKYFEVRAGSRTLRGEYDGQKDLVRSEIDRAISLYEDFMHTHEQVSMASGQKLVEGGRDGQNLKGLKAIRREMSQ